mmetsp:Transcript_32959/g.55250  ORF Transcript_32959/g.55250 Transcript_32959/m.55250 type:complete len:100 (+) Transcript_32959:1689-1988(+)
MSTGEMFLYFKWSNPKCSLTKTASLSTNMVPWTSSSTSKQTCPTGFMNPTRLNRFCNPLSKAMDVVVLPTCCLEAETYKGGDKDDDVDDVDCSCLDDVP